MQAIGFNEHYGLQTAVLEKRKTMTRRQERGFDLLTETNHRFEDGVVKFYFEGSFHPTIIKPRYHVGEVVAIRQCYRDIINQLNDRKREYVIGYYSGSKAWTNKLYVRPDLMPHHIRITDIKVERLQNISREDCLREGIDDDSADGSHLYWYSVPSNLPNWRKLGDKVMRHEWDGQKGCWFWDTAQGAFSALINVICGKGTWERNQFMPAYTFELID